MFYNPNSGRFNGRRLEKLLATLNAHFGNCLLVSDPEKLRKIRNAHILSVGGDGTFHIAINNADLDSNTFTCMAMGSGNDFVTAFPKRGIEVLCFRIKENNWAPIDLIKADNIYIHNVGGVGFEAFVSQKAHQKKPIITALKYVIPVVRNLFVFKPIQLTIQADSFVYSGSAFMLSFGNGRRAGGGFRLFPKASLTDGKLDILLIKPPTIVQKIMYVWLVNFGKHLRLKIVEYHQVKSCKIVLEKTGLFDADGDIYSKKEIHAVVMPGLLKVIQ